MTLEEKVGQLNQVHAGVELRHQVRELVRKGYVGSRILAATAHAGGEAQNTAEVEEDDLLQRIAVEETRLGIPLLSGKDVIHGHRTVFPIPLALAASFDMDLVRQAAEVAAREARADGVHWTFAPMLDVSRDPRWGRVIEGPGEDPYVGGLLAAAMVRGFQGAGPDPESPIPAGRLLACAKHYVGYGTTIGGRDYNGGDASWATLWNVYLPPFVAAVEAGVGTVMTAFLDLDGEPVTGSRRLLAQALRERLGFRGFVVSDWESVGELVSHRVAADRLEAAHRAFNAGVDMEMVSGCYRDHLVSLVQAGRVPVERVDEAVLRVLTQKYRLGLFEHPYTDRDQAARVQRAPAHLELARKTAAATMVLLKNRSRTGDPVLPLSGTESVLLAGPFAGERRALLGSWTMDGRADETPTLAEALRSTDLGLVVAGSVDEALARAPEADVVIYATGEQHSRTGENCNVAILGLPPGEPERILALRSRARCLVVVVFAGRPLPVDREAEAADALLWAWHPGSEGAPAVVDILLGRVNPSGRLPITIARHQGQLPLYYAQGSTGRPRGDYYTDDSRYQDMPGSPLYPFGYGCSYTTFDYEGLVVSPATLGLEALRGGATYTVSVTVRNTGGRPGAEVVQLYVRDDVALMTRPVRELKGVVKIALSAGEERRVEMSLGYAELSYRSRTGEPSLEPGTHTVWVGGSCLAALGAGLRVEP
jgi:beta-glucosidase